MRYDNTTDPLWEDGILRALMIQVREAFQAATDAHRNRRAAIAQETWDEACARLQILTDRARKDVLDNIFKAAREADFRAPVLTVELKGEHYTQMRTTELDAFSPDFEAAPTVEPASPVQKFLLDFRGLGVPLNRDDALVDGVYQVVYWVDLHS